MLLARGPFKARKPFKGRGPAAGKSPWGFNDGSTVPNGAVITRSGEYVIDRAGNYVVVR